MEGTDRRKRQDAPPVSPRICFKLLCVERKERPAAARFKWQAWTLSTLGRRHAYALLEPSHGNPHCFTTTRALAVDAHALRCLDHADLHKRAFAVLSPASLILHPFHPVVELSAICQPSASHRATVSSQRLGPPVGRLLFHATHWLPNLRGDHGAEASVTK
jgi:hypothetical protein